MFSRTIIQSVAQIEKLPAQHHGKQRAVSVMFIALINIERAYANSVVNNDMDRIIDIFGRRNGRAISFDVFYELT